MIVKIIYLIIISDFRYSIKCVIAPCDTEVYWGPLEPWHEKNELSLSPNLPNSSHHSQRCLSLHESDGLKFVGYIFWSNFLIIISLAVLDGLSKIDLRIPRYVQVWYGMMYRVSSKTVYTSSLFVNCASHSSLIIKWSTKYNKSIYLFHL